MYMGRFCIRNTCKEFVLRYMKISGLQNKYLLKVPLKYFNLLVELCTYPILTTILLSVHFLSQVNAKSY